MLCRLSIYISAARREVDRESRLARVRAVMRDMLMHSVTLHAAVAQQTATPATTDPMQEDPPCPKLSQ